MNLWSAVHNPKCSCVVQKCLSQVLIVYSALICYQLAHQHGCEPQPDCSDYVVLCQRTIFWSAVGLMVSIIPASVMYKDEDSHSFIRSFVFVFLTLCNVLRIMHCLLLAILSHLSRFHPPAVGTNWPILCWRAVKHQTNKPAGCCIFVIGVFYCKLCYIV